MKTLLPLMLIVFSFVAISAQDKPSLDKWHGMVLDQTTPAQALEVFTSPKEDKTGQSFRPAKYNEWFNVKDNKNFRVIHWENIEGFGDVKLYFLSDKLVAIHLEPDKLKASLVSKTYGVEFEPVFGGADKVISPGDFDRSNGKSTARRFPTVYYLMYQGAKSYAFVMVDNSSFGSVLGKTVGVEDDPNSVPGKAKILELISRSLENKQGTDLLK